MTTHSYKLYLFLAGPASSNESLVMSNVRQCLDQSGESGYSLEVVDVVKDPKAALEEGVFFTPTLLRVFPLPKKKVIGSLQDKQKTLAAVKLLQTM